MIREVLCATAQRFAFAKHGAGAGVDSVWEQEKPEAREMLENAAESHLSGAPKKIAGDHFIREKQECNGKSILRSGRQSSRTKQWRAN